MIFFFNKNNYHLIQINFESVAVFASRSRHLFATEINWTLNENTDGISYSFSFYDCGNMISSTAQV